MKITSLLISILVFLISGVMVLFSTSEVFAQVPQTKRSEQDSFLKNIRAKKRNNDLQKSRQGNNRSKYMKNLKPRRLRFFLDKKENVRTSPQLEGIEETNNFSFYYIFQNYGIGYSEYNFKGFWKDWNFSEVGEVFVPHESGEVKSINLYYTFGNKLSLTLGYPLYAEGNAVVGDESGQHSYKTLFKPKLRKRFWSLLDTEDIDGFYLDVGYYIGFLEINFRIISPIYFFKEFECVRSCDDIGSGDEGLIWGTHRTFTFGIGLVF